MYLSAFIHEVNLKTQRFYILEVINCQFMVSLLSTQWTDVFILYSLKHKETTKYQGLYIPVSNLLFHKTAGRPLLLPVNNKCFCICAVVQCCLQCTTVLILYRIGLATLQAFSFLSSVGDKCVHCRFSIRPYNPQNYLVFGPYKSLFQAKFALQGLFFCFLFLVFT